VARRADGVGPVIGTALEGFAGEGEGKVLAFVSRGGGGLAGGSATETARLEERQDELEARLDERTPDPLTGVQSVAGSLQLVLDRGADDEARLSVFRDGEEEGALGAEVFRVDEEGNVYARGSFRPDSMDLAEYFPVSGPVDAGDLLVVDRERPGSYWINETAADPAVVGVVSSEPGVLLGSGVRRISELSPELAASLEEARAAGDREEEAALWQAMEARFRAAHAPVALSGTVPCKVDAGYGEIRPGDLLTASPTPGHAMRADEALPGTVVGKALEPLEAGTGVIRILVMLR
jgi:hypothetical protein